MVPEGNELALKGVAVALADGISTSPVSRIAAETAVKSFLLDYYCTSEAWSVRTAGLSVISASNAWLYNETRHSHMAYDLDRGYLCTFSALVVKGRFAHTFHVGDSRIHRVVGDSLEPLTVDHRVTLSSSENYLSRALGIAEFVEVDYAQHVLIPGDVYVLSTDGVHQFVGAKQMVEVIRAHVDDLGRAAERIAAIALECGSDDNLTLQIVRIDRLPDGDMLDYASQAEALPPPGIPEPPSELDGYQLVRQIHASDRSHIYLALDPGTGARVALKVPAQSLRAEPELLGHFMMEEWIARRVSSPHLLRSHVSPRRRSYLYVVTEFVEGSSLRQWIYDHPKPDLATARGLIEQIVRGVRALHRKEMIHCDLRPENILIDHDGTVKIIDFGSVRVTGLEEAAAKPPMNALLGTVQYTAPEWLVGEAPTWRSDLFSVAVIAYEMLTGELPYGAHAARVRSPAQQRALRYRSARSARVPDWVDGALKTALHPDPSRRYDAMSEFVSDLRTPNPRFRIERHAPLLERDPVLFWKALSVILLVVLMIVLALDR